MCGAGLSSGAFFGEVALVTASKEVRRTCSIVASTVLSLLRLSRAGLNEVANNEPGVLMHIRQVAINRRREIGEDVRALSKVAITANLVHGFARKLSVKQQHTRELVRQTTMYKMKEQRKRYACKGSHFGSALL